MKVLRKFLVAVVALCVLTVSAWASDFQKNENRQQPPPPDKREKEIPKGEKPPPPPPRNENRGNQQGKKGRP